MNNRAKRVIASILTVLNKNQLPATRIDSLIDDYRQEFLQQQLDQYILVSLLNDLKEWAKLHNVNFETAYTETLGEANGTTVSGQKGTLPCSIAIR